MKANSVQNMNIRELKIGMRLKADVHGSNQRLLATAETILDEKLLRVFNIWGVTEASVHDAGNIAPGEDIGSAVDPELLAQCWQKVNDMVNALPDDSEFGKELLRLGPLWQCRAIQTLGHHKADPFALQGLKGSSAKAVREAPLSLQGFLSSSQRLSALPKVYTQVREALADPRCSSNRIADIVGKDVGMSARLLKLVNSPFYGQASKVDTILRGVTVLGFKELGQLVLVGSVSTMFPSVSPEILSPRLFWEHCAACGVIARLLAAHKPGMNSERLFVAGLLHDIGRMFMLNVMPDQLAFVIDQGSRESLFLRQAEEETFGYCHDDVGADILQRWQLPATLVDIIRHHHQPGKAEDVVSAALLCVADSMTTTVGYGTSGNLCLSPSAAHAWDMLGLPLSVLDTVMMQAERQISEIFQIFFG